MALIEPRYCRLLLDPRFAEIGVDHAGETWRVILAQPLLPPDLGDWRSAGARVLGSQRGARRAAQLRRASASRRRRRSPGTTRWRRRRSAHSRDMARRNYFDHASPDRRAPRPSA